MKSSVEMILILTLLANLVLAGSSRLSFCIRILAVEGTALGLLPLCMPDHEWSLRVFFLVALTVLLKGLFFPWFLIRAQRVAGIHREVEPYVGYSASIVGGVLALAVSLWLGARLELPKPPEIPLLVPAALFTVLTGLFLIVSRRTALNQVIGYLVLENGIYIFGITLAREEPFLIETGVLLDIFAAVFVMGITVFHISREFDHIDVDQLSKLRD